MNELKRMILDNENPLLIFDTIMSRYKLGWDNSVYSTQRVSRDNLKNTFRDGMDECFNVLYFLMLDLIEESKTKTLETNNDE